MAPLIRHGISIPSNPSNARSSVADAVPAPSGRTVPGGGAGNRTQDNGEDAKSNQCVVPVTPGSWRSIFLYALQSRSRQLLAGNVEASWSAVSCTS